MERIESDGHDSSNEDLGSDEEQMQTIDEISFDHKSSNRDQVKSNGKVDGEKKTPKSNRKSSNSKKHSTSSKKDGKSSTKRKNESSKSLEKEDSKKKKRSESTNKEDYDSEYFKRMYYRSKDPFHDPTDKELFCENLLNHIKGKEIELCEHKYSSSCIEWLIEHGHDKKFVKNCAETLAPEKLSLDFLQNESSSGVLKTLIEALINTLSKESNMESDGAKWILKYIESFAKLVLENIGKLLQTSNENRILITTIEAIGGIKVGSHWSRQSMRFASGVKLDLKTEIEKYVALKEIPQSFRHYLKKISKALVLDALDQDIMDTIITRFTLVAQYLLFVLKIRYYELCQLVVKRFVEVIFASDSNRDMVTHSANSAYIMEIIMLVASETRLNKIWTKHLKGNLRLLWEHDIANFIVQRMIDAIKDEKLFADVCEEIFPHMGDIFKFNRPGIGVCLAKKCLEFKKMQSNLITALLKGYNCYEPKEKQLDLVPNLLFVDSKSRIPHTKFFIWLQGSLILQYMFIFQDPYKVSKSLLSLPIADILRICKDRSGSHTIDSFLHSDKVATKHKSELVERFLGHYHYLSMDKFGSRVVENIISLSDNNVKRAIMTELTEHESKIKSNRNGLFVARNTGLNYFKHKPSDWFKYNRVKRRDDSKNVIGGPFGRQTFLQSKRL